MISMPSIYVVDHDAGSREMILRLVTAAGFGGIGFASGHDFLLHPRDEAPGCLVLDVGVPETTGLELQRKLNAESDDLPIIFVSGRRDVPASVAAVKAGAVDFLAKPFDGDALLDAIRRALAQVESHGPRRLRRTRIGSSASVLTGIVGASRALDEVLRQIKTVARTETTVLIQGETGTGKEKIARALHDLSDRKHGRFVKVNCAAIPMGLLESELMGHERGAFTGAVAQRIGRFELAHDGTIFLDEIGELPLEMQPKLLRILQEREFERVGSTKTVHTNARVVAATNRDLTAMMNAGTFREDLYYRLSVFPVRVPPLRERLQDIPLLARHFVREMAARMGKQVRELSPEVLDRLVRYRWPGNIRELQNVLERSVILAHDGVVHVPELGVSASPLCRADAASKEPFSAGDSPRSDGLADVSRAHILRVLTETNWVVAGPHGAAARLEMKRSTLNFRMKKLGIVRPRP